MRLVVSTKGHHAGGKRDGGRQGIIFAIRVHNTDEDI